MVPLTTSKKNSLIKELPFKMANLAPSMDPVKLKIAIGIAYWYKMWPLLPKKTMEPKLVARFTNFACALALIKSNPSALIKKSTRKLPAPGPIKPS